MGTDKCKEKDMKEKFSKEYLQQLKLTLRSKLNERNQNMTVNTWAISIMRYSARILKWNTNELKRLDKRARKFMTMHGALYWKSDVDRVYHSNEMGGKDKGIVRDV